MKLNHAQPETVNRDSGTATANGRWFRRFVSLPLDVKTKSDLRVTARRWYHSHPNNAHIEVMVRLDWPSYAETHFLAEAAADAMIRKHVRQANVES
jgi:hypothetical protein